MKRVIAAVILIGVCAVAVAADAVPLLRTGNTRDVRVTMYVGSDRTLVRETCQMFIPQGSSDVRFQWTDADIDAASIALNGPADVRIGGLRQPFGTTKTYSWPVAAEQAGLRTFTASYFVKGIQWSASYYITFDAASSKASLLGKLHITNSGKLPLQDAKIELCAAPTGVLDKLEQAETGRAPDTYAALEHCTLEPGWQKRFTFFRARDLDCQLVYRAEPESRGEEIRKYLLLSLQDLKVPGALPTGHLEIYEMVGGKRVPVAAADLVHATDKETELSLGVERDIIYERETMQRRKTAVEFDRIGRVSGYDMSEDYTNAFRSRLPLTARIEFVETLPGKWDLATKDEPTAKETNLVRWGFDLEPGARKSVAFTITRHTGSRAD